PGDSPCARSHAHADARATGTAPRARTAPGTPRRAAADHLEWATHVSRDAFPRSHAAPDRRTDPPPCPWRAESARLPNRAAPSFAEGTRHRTAGIPAVGAPCRPDRLLPKSAPDRAAHARPTPGDPRLCPAVDRAGEPHA